MDTGPATAVTFSDFRKSFFFGSRSNPNFKFLEHLTDDDPAAVSADPVPDGAARRPSRKAGCTARQRAGGAGPAGQCATGWNR